MMSSRRSLTVLGLPRDILDALVREGYTLLEDLANVSLDTLETELNIPRDTASDLIRRCRNPSMLTPSHPLTQSVAKLVKDMPRLSTKCLALDSILDGGLPPGHVMEISGPPGSPKELLAINILASSLERRSEVIFTDCQDTISQSSLCQKVDAALSSSMDWKQFVHYTRLPALADLLILLHNLPSFLQSHPKIAALVINSVSSPFQTANLSTQQRKHHIEAIKQSLSRVCTLHDLTVVTVSQMATKMVNVDGTPGTFDSGAKGIMVPQLGSAYLPNGRSYQVVLAPDGLASGTVKVLSSPFSPKQVLTGAYSMVHMISSGRLVPLLMQGPRSEKRNVCMTV